MSITLDEFLQSVRESRLISDEHLQQFLDGHPQADQIQDPRRLAFELVRGGLLTRFQASRIYKGRPDGLIVGNIELQEIIGAGGMGTVYRARHRRMDRRVAIKILSDNGDHSAQALRRFQREVRAAARLVHPNIVTAFDADEQDGQMYLVMEYVDGEDLSTLIEREGPFNLAKAINCVVQAARGLQFAHSRGIVHRDIKPNNLLYDISGAIKILDLGLARFEDPSDRSAESTDGELTGEYSFVGTVEFMSPEQADSAATVDSRTDIYSLGCTFYYLLTAKTPYYRRSLIATLAAHRDDAIPLLRDAVPEIPAAVEAIFARCVAKRPQDRYETMAELIRDLNQFDDDTDFHLSESMEFSILDEDESETRVFSLEELGSPAAAKAPDDVSSPPAEPAVGIDLGTTFSVVAYLDESGRPQTLVNAEGEKTTPSAVLFDADEMIIGKEAIKAMSLEMELVADCAKRELGSTSYHKRIRGRSYPPEVLLACILKKLHQDAQAQIGDFQRAVVTVPAYFDEVRRKATQDAGFLAGLDVVDIINEPTAAAIAYGYYRQTRPAGEGADQGGETVLVYDLGGGTFDVTIMRIDGQSYVALATDGDVRLGGRDWDLRIVDAVAAEFQRQFQVDPRNEPNALGRLIRECEEVKRTLSSRKKTVHSFDCQGHTLRMEISRAAFEQWTDDLLERTSFTTRQTMSACRLGWNQIDRILLVGGATRMPAVPAMLEQLSGIAPDRTLSPDEAVAHGAALRAGVLRAERCGSAAVLSIRNVNSHSLGAVAVNLKTGEKETATLIPRNSPLPAKATRVFHTRKSGQESIRINIVEGESKRPEDCAKIGKCVVRGLPEDLPGRTPVEVTFSYNESGRLTVIVQVGDLKLKQHIHRENALSPRQRDKWRDRLASGIFDIDEDMLTDLD